MSKAKSLGVKRIYITTNGSLASLDKIKSLKDHRIPTNIYYPKTLIEQKTFSNYSKGNFKNAKFLSKHILSLPLHPYMKLNEQDYIFKILKKLS